jgi:cation diffusion facilitator CzcD-associated flavoprotein CzcO
MGAINEPSIPPIPGLESFEGETFHSARWNHDHDLDGARVAVIGTGASAAQFVPAIQPRVRQLHLFQRTPAWILPRSDRLVTRLERLLFRALPITQKIARGAIYVGREFFVLGFAVNPRFMAIPEFVARAHLKRQVADPALRRKLSPSDRIGCKRIIISDEYYPALAQPNAEVVTDAIKEVRPRSIVTADGTEREIDTIVFGTGFRVADMPSARRIRGRGGVLLSELWNGSPQAYRGTTVAGFPNLFTLIGPNTVLSHTSMVFMIESQVNYVIDCLRTMDADGLATVEVRPEAQDAYNRQLERQMEGTVWSSGCMSWYLNAQGKNTTLWPGFTWRFRQQTRHFDAAAYDLVRRSATAPPLTESAA